MLNLVIKDFILQKKLIIFSLGYGIFLFFSFSFPALNTMVYSLGAIMIAYITFMAIISSEDKNRSDVILNSLPLKRAHIVISKYIGLFIIVLFAFLLMGSLGALFNLLGFPPVQRLVSIYDLMVTFTFVGFLGSIYYPLYLKFGAKYMVIFNLLFFIAVFSIPGLITKVVMDNKGWAYITDYLKAVLNEPFWFMSVSVALTLMVVFISMLFSIRIYKNKEF